MAGTFDFTLIRDGLMQVERRLQEVAAVDFPALASILNDLLQSGGKRLRPALVLLAARFYSQELARAATLAAAVETLHTATLVHDDLIDNSLRRRGHATLNTTWTSSIVVLVGDYLFAKAAELAAEAQSTEANELFAQTVAIICDGELRSFLEGKGWQITRQDYYDRIYAKTASLFAASSEVGAVINGSQPDQRRRLREYGRNVGMAFQIVDDILDFTGDEAELGKPVGNDLRQGTVTLPAICYLERSHDHEPIRRILEGEASEETILAVIKRIRDSEAIAESYAEARVFVQRARDALAALPDVPSRQVMLDLADFVVDRKS